MDATPSLVLSAYVAAGVCLVMLVAAGIGRLVRWRNTRSRSQ
jgi:hypothetical protein